MEAFKHKTIRTRFSVLIISLFVLIYLLISAALYINRRDQVLTQTQDRLFSQIDDAAKLYETHHEQTQSCQKAINSLDKYFEYVQFYRVEEQDSLSTALANDTLHSSDTLIEEEDFFGEEDFGFENDLLLEDTPFLGENLMDADTTFNLSQPLSEKMEKAVVLANLKDSLHQYISTDTIMAHLNQKQYFSDGYLFIFTSKGKVLQHPKFKVGTDISKNQAVKEILSSTYDQGSFTLAWPPDANEQENRRFYYRYNEDLQAYLVISVKEADIFAAMRRLVIAIFVGLLLTSSLILIGLSLILRRLSNDIKQLANRLSKLAAGILPDHLKIKHKDELGETLKAYNKLLDGLRNNARFAQEMGEGKLDIEFTPLSKSDVLGNALLSMRESLVHSKAEDEKRQIEDYKQSWTAQGIAKFGDILRQNNDDIIELSHNIIQNLVHYTDSIMGGIFIYQDENPNDLHLALTGAYAYDRRKYFKKKVLLKEGLVGTCAVERKTAFLTKLPDDYVEVESGLGESQPQSLLLVPFHAEDRLIGVLEIASFNIYQKHEIAFIEKVAESIASTIASVKITERTNRLLEESEHHSQIMISQEEEMRQNVEELQATQEEMKRREQELLKQNEDARQIEKELRSQLAQKEAELMKYKQKS